MKLKNRKGINIGDLPNIGIAFMVLSIVLGLSVLVPVKMKDSISSASANATIDAVVKGPEEVANWMEIIGIMVAASVIIGLVGFFYMRRGA